MAPLLYVPMKKPSQVDVTAPLKNLISSSYSTITSESGERVNPDEYTSIIMEFENLRNKAIWKFFEMHESSLEVVYGYYDQLCSLETKFAASDLQIPFKWTDAFDKGSLFSGRMSLTLTTLTYDKVCILFNIAALQSTIASGQSLNNDDGLKLATKLFQQSAGIFDHLKSIAPAAISQEPTPDLHPDALQALSSIMIAQAQECFVLKAIRDDLNEAVIAKLSCQCEEMYAEALRGLQKESLRNLWNKDWLAIVDGNQAGYDAMTQFYQSLVCRANKEVGEEIARLTHALDLFKAAKSRSGRPNWFEKQSKRAKRNLVEARKDNDLIYNAMIPEIMGLPSPGKALLAKPTPLTGRMSDSKDLFAKLVPLAMQQALSACESRRTDFVNTEIMNLREATQTLNGVLASLNLPAAIEVTSGGALPQSLIEKADEVRNRGGIENVRHLITKLPESLVRNREILDVTERMLNKEKQSDEKLRAQFKERWSRTPSDNLTEVFRTNLGKYREVINSADGADKIVREKFKKNKSGIDLLSKSGAQLKDALPTGAANVDQSASQTLWQLMDRVTTMKAERDKIESDLKTTTVNLKDKFQAALQLEGTINEPEISIPGIWEKFAPLRKAAIESVSQQETLIKEIQDAHAAFSAANGSTNGSRETFLCELATAHNSFIELQDNLQEGIEFYNNLTQMLLALQNNVNDFCFARKTEKDELLKDLTEQSSRAAEPANPLVPAHFPVPAARQVPASVSVTDGPVPYPTQMQGMPVPYGASANAPYPTYVPPPMPQGFNPYATLPYPQNAYNYQNFPTGPTMQHYGTYPGNYAHMQQQQQPYPGYPGGQPQPGPGYPQ